MLCSTFMGVEYDWRVLRWVCAVEDPLEKVEHTWPNSSSFNNNIPWKVLSCLFLA